MSGRGGKRPALWALILVLALAGGLRFWNLGRPALIGDEAYYRLWADRLALCYYDNPAGVALLVRAGSALAPASEWGTRWLNALLGVISAALVCALGWRLFSPWPGVVGGAVFAVGAPTVLVGRFVYTDTLYITLLLSTTLALLPFAQRDRERYVPLSTGRFVVAGLSMAALLNTKYGAYLYALAAGLILAWYRRDLTRDRRAWAALGIALAGFLPALGWNAAQGWVSWRWQVAHFSRGAVGPSTLVGNAWHSLRYLTPPVILLAAPGVTRFRGPQRQLLLGPALALLVPVALSPANSPRNLVAGVALLLPLAGEAICRWWGAWRPVGVLAVALVAWAGLAGLGTAMATWREVRLPQSSAAAAIRAESAGWREARALPLEGSDYVFAIDYQIAAQLRNYTGRPVYTSWGQYQIWGIPDLCRSPGGGESTVDVVALSYVDPGAISARLTEAFRGVSGPAEFLLGGEKMIRIWRAEGCRIESERLMERLDIMELAGE